ncbi:hypothetical protein ACNA06_22430 [Lysinibacillus sp. RSDA_15]|uniref:hypothetical protein n=1 Tax=Lysinibacillus TaxID=400634 RepID=UPI002DB68C9C|nr:hypothetical protein [Lysinibacillus sphaericus]MEB7453653.1 hypothetical protein [Lysinibacillus sphaericus]
MEIEVSIDKFVVDYKDVPYSTFLRVYMVGVQKYKVKIKIYSGTYSYELQKVTMYTFICILRTLEK